MLQGDPWKVHGSGLVEDNATKNQNINSVTNCRTEELQGDICEMLGLHGDTGRVHENGQITNKKTIK